MTDYPADFEPKEALTVRVRLPMVSLTLPLWKGDPLRHDFGGKPCSTSGKVNEVTLRMLTRRG
jgi:hypothetical protein